MQQFDIYLRAASVKAALVDQFNNAISAKVSLTRGMQAELVLYLFHTSEEDSKYTAEELSAFAAWNFCADSDYDLNTTPKLRVSSGITVAEDGGIHIPVLETNTEEVISYLGNAESKDLKCELVGMTEGETLPEFCLQWEISIRNRIGGEGTGQPTPVEDGNYTAAQVNAIIAAPNEVEYSIDGETWSETCPPGATQRRYKNSAVSGAVWTVESLAQGPAGTNGTDGTDGQNGQNGTDGATYYPYIAYAANATGILFSLTPTSDRKYRAEFHTTAVIAEPTLADFVSAGAVWVKYIGDNGNGDMSTADYVSAGGTGVVVSASGAASVPWTGVSGKPATFTPAAHKHPAADISDGARQTVFRGSSPQELYIDRQIIQRSNVISNGVLNLDFSAIRVSSGGSTYNASAGDVFTWEYWVFANTDIVSLNLGSGLTISALEDEPLPEELPVKGTGSTLHAFAIRAFYKSGAVQNLKVTANYLYSTEA